MTYRYVSGGFPGSSAIKNLPMQKTLETRGRSLGQKYPLEQEIAAHSDILASTISWIEEPSRLQSMGLQRVGHN